MNIVRGSHFFVRKLHSLTGVVPIGAFVALHLWGNAFARYGPEAYNEHLDNLRRLPYYPVGEVLLIWLPLIIHAFYGLAVTLEARNNVDRYPFARNWSFWFQRVTGAITFAFIAYHTATQRLNELFGAPTASFEKVREAVSDPFVLGFYLVGIVSATWHLANGLWLFGVNWGILVGPRAQRIATRVLTVFWIALAAVAVNAIFAFLT